jgi:hypothetical protein
MLVDFLVDYLDVKTEEKVGKLRGDIVTCRDVFTSFFLKKKKNQLTPPKSKPFSLRMKLKIPYLSRGLEWSSSKVGCSVFPLNLFVRKVPPIAVILTSTVIR